MAVKNLQARFEQAQKDIMTLNRRPDNDDLLILYALYKQGSQGDVSTPRPGLLNLVGRAKHDAWARLRGLKPTTAMQQYIDKVAALLESHR
jgi:acyl-CoA-binding protein